MMRFAFFLLLLSFSINGIGQSFREVSKMVSRYQVKQGISRSWAHQCYDIRDELYKSDKINFIDKSDTIYFLESSDIESRNIYGKIWNKFGHLEYVVYNKGSFRFDVDGVYTEYTCKLLEAWDTTSIKYEEKVNPAGFSPDNIYGTRIIKVGSNLKIDCIMFKEFFKLERDR